jgi:glycosyltransferase involved in cell wall biosynthesis
VKKILVIIPCFNEEASIAGVIKSFPKVSLAATGFELDILVVDNNSSDRTAAIALGAGVRVLHELKQGKGNAMRAGFNSVAADVDYVVMLDGDGTYRPEEIWRLIEPIDSGFCDVVIGSRLGGRIPKGTMTRFNRAGNWIFSHLVRYGYKVNVTDVLTGYFAWRRSAIVGLRPHLASQGFAIEMEMITKLARLGHEIYSVPISYNPRSGASSLRPVRDGSRILWMFLSNLIWIPHRLSASPTQPTKKGRDIHFAERVERKHK